MKTCPACGLNFADRYLFCTEDGSKLVEAGEDYEAPAATATKEAADNARPAPRVLYCPACAMEYPLTFAACPVDGAVLNKERMGAASTRRSEPASSGPAPSEPPQAEAVSAVGLDKAEPAAPKPLEQSLPPQPEVSRDASDLSFAESNDRPHVRKIILTPEVEDAILRRAEPVQSASPFTRRQASNNSLFGNADINSAEQPRAPERKGFRLAAAAIAIGLSVFALASLYTFSADARRKPLADRSETAQQSEAKAEESLFIPTPQSALEYKEHEPELITPAESEEPRAELQQRSYGANRSSVAAVEGKQGTQSQGEAPPPRRSQDTTPEPPQAPMTRATHTPEMPLPRASNGKIESNLTRVRGRRTQTGFRYDLTFTLREMTGNALRWEQLLIATLASSGLRHTEVIPFRHRLGGSGMMTFTVSVEMPGASEADWRGRIICTGIGYDDAGRSTRTAFSANVSP